MSTNNHYWLILILARLGGEADDDTVLTPAVWEFFDRDVLIVPGDLDI